MLLHTSVARAVDTFEAKAAVTDVFCQLSQTSSADVFKLPELGGSYTFINTGIYIEGLNTGSARLTGVITGGSPLTEFAVDLLLDGRLDEGDVGYDQAKTDAVFLVQPGCLPDPLGWHFYTSLTGTLTGLSGLVFGEPVAGAVYNVTLGAILPQVGLGANTHNPYFGAFAEIWFELAQGNGDLPVGPYAGEVSFHADEAGMWTFPASSPNLTGTWNGVIDCAGILDFTDVETFYSSMVLKVMPREIHDEVDSIFYFESSYIAELSNAGGDVVATYCVKYTIDPRGGQINKGWMDNNELWEKYILNISNMSVLFKVKEVKQEDDSVIATLKARGFFTIPDGGDIDPLPDGQNFCKWTFTQVATAVPVFTIPPDFLTCPWPSAE
jgi:hypothetical protein